MNILITGVAGFIGFSLANKLVQKHKVYGVDNLNNYYSAKLKKKRLNLLKNYKNFEFKKLDINSFSKLNPEFVLIHDGARPFLPKIVIDDILLGLETEDCVIPVLGINDSLKEAVAGRITRSIDRNQYLRTQTPQGFRYSKIMEAHIAKRGLSLSDDAALLEESQSLATVNGSEELFKITYGNDIKKAAQFIVSNFEYRVGHGFDVHSFFVNCHLKEELPNIKAICMLQTPPDRISLLQDRGDEIILQDYFTIIQANENKSHTYIYKDFLTSLEMTYEMNNFNNRKSIENYCKLHNMPFVYLDTKFALKDFSIKPSVARDCQHHGETENIHIANKVIEKLDK